MFTPEIEARAQEPGHDFAAKQLDKKTSQIASLGVKRQDA